MLVNCFVRQARGNRQTIKPRAFPQRFLEPFVVRDGELAVELKCSINVFMPKTSQSERSRSICDYRLDFVCCSIFFSLLYRDFFVFRVKNVLKYFFNAAGVKLSPPFTTFRASLAIVDRRDAVANEHNAGWKNKIDRGDLRLCIAH